MISEGTKEDHGRIFIETISLHRKEENKIYLAVNSNSSEVSGQTQLSSKCLPTIIINTCTNNKSPTLISLFRIVCFTILSVLNSIFKNSSIISLHKCLLSHFRSYKSWSRILCSTLLALSFQWGGAAALRITSLEVPPHHVSGKSVELLCNYDLENDVLYSVKWYRGTYEFFRYIPGAQIPLQVFDAKGIFIDTSLSDKHRVTLRTVTRKSSGKYKCEVSADESFYTVSKTAEMLVVDLPSTEPNITGGQVCYHMSDEIHVNCTSGKSRPAASLMWYINNRQAKLDDLVEFAPEQDEDGLEISRLGLKFFVGAKDFPDGILTIRCSATIAAVYYQSTEKTLEGQLPQTSPALESKGAYTGANAGVNSSVLLLLSSKLCLATIARYMSSR